MSDKSNQLRKLLESMVRAEVNRVVPMLVKEEMLKVMGGMLMEGRSSRDPEVWEGNSEKRREMMVDAPTNSRNFDRSAYEEEIGWEAPGVRRAPTSRRGGITVEARLNEHGQPIPIAPQDIPDIVHQAMNRDYREVMKALEAKKNGF